MKQLKSWARSYLPPAVARVARYVGVYARYLIQAQVCRQGFKEFGRLHPQKILFIAGLPKSGSTWLKKMVSSYPGFHGLLIPEASVYDLETGGAHDYDLPNDTFSRFKDMLVVTKMHAPGSSHNVQLLHSADIKYVVLYRDLRDVAVSYFFYVRKTPWHSEYPIYSELSVREGLKKFADRTLLAYANWIRMWHKNRDPEMAIEVQYEQMLSDTVRVMINIARHFELDSSPETVSDIVEAHSFQRLSGGRSRGKESQDSFFRKGVSGDWKNHFDPGLKELYKELIGDFLIEFGYEKDYSW
jgi:hypothetical protein